MIEGVLIFALAVALIGAVLLWAMPGECTCSKCHYHTSARAAKLLKEHDRVHSQLGVPRGRKHCSRCPAEDE